MLYDDTIFFSFMLLILWMFLKSVYHPTHALHDTPFMTYINSYTFWQQVAILRES